MLRKGTFKFNQDANFNFRLNRVVMWGNGDPKEIAGVAKTITDSKSWVKAMTGLAEKAERKAEQKRRSDICVCQNPSCMIWILKS